MAVGFERAWWSVRNSLLFIYFRGGHILHVLNEDILYKPAEITLSLPAPCHCCPASQPFSTRGGLGRPPSANRSPCIFVATKRWTDHRPISRDPPCQALPFSPRSRSWSLTTWRWAQWPPPRRDKPSWVWRSPRRRYFSSRLHKYICSSQHRKTLSKLCLAKKKKKKMCWPFYALSVVFYWPLIAFKVIFQIKNYQNIQFP